MQELFVMKDEGGRCVLQTTSRVMLEREEAWHRASGSNHHYHFSSIKREGLYEFGVGAPRRYCGPWPRAKVAEFKERYEAGEEIKKLEEWFDTPASSLARRARALGLAVRNRYQTQWTLKGGYMRPWLFQRDELEKMICEGFDNDQIAERLNRSSDGVRGERRKLNYPTSHAIDKDLLSIFVNDGMNVELAAFILDDFHGSRAFIDRAKVRFRKMYHEAKLEDVRIWRENWDARREAWRIFKEVKFHERQAKEVANRAKVEEAKAVIDEWAPLGVTTKEMAAFCGMSENTFKRFRAKHYGPQYRRVNCVTCTEEFGTFNHHTKKCKKCREVNRTVRKTASSRILPVSENWQSEMS